MKISILTFSKELNNGAELQCYSLCKVLKQWGHDINVIDIQLESRLPLKSKILNLYSRILFSRFWSKYIPFTRKYKTVVDLEMDPPMSDLYIVGSDQVWNPDITKRLDPKVYFFHFLPEGSVRIAYAASIAKDVWAWPDLIQEVKPLIEKFKAVSVREESGIRICKETFGVDAELVCDPTILSESYDEICGSFDETKLNKELLYFKIIRDKQIDNIVALFAKENGLLARNIRDRRKKPGFIRTAYTSVKSWLNYIRYSKFVVTDSFHGLVFSILFHKQFLALPSQKDRAGRHYNLLCQLGLEDRFCSNVSDLKSMLESAYSNNIDYDLVDARLSDMRNKGLMFLRTSIGNI